MLTSRLLRTKLVAASVAGAFALAACGDGGSSAEPAQQLPAVPDEVEVRPESNIPTNLLPDLVVDNLNEDNKVNLRNVVPSDRPIVFWMYAPH